MQITKNITFLNMKKLLTFLILIILPFTVFAGDLPEILSENDAKIYSQIFNLQSHEKIDAAIKLEKQLSGDLLMDEVLFQRYTSKTYRTRGAEIQAWMKKYYNMPGAKRMTELAKIKKASVRSTILPGIITGKSIESPQSENWTKKQYYGTIDKEISKFKRAIKTGSTKTARLILEEKSFKKKVSADDYGRLAGRLSFVYYTNGEFELAKKWGFVASDADSEYGLWSMGLLYFKENKFSESQKYFSKMLNLQQINDARKTEIAFWAGRAADKNDDRKSAKKYWRIGAKHPMAFYGALSSMMLGDEPVYEFFEQDISDEDIEELQKSQYGKKALALLQIEEKNRAEKYLLLMITKKASDRSLHAVNSISNVFELPRVSVQIAGVIRERDILEIDNDIIYSAQYPLPDWEPMGGWSIDRALLFAITKQESGFKAYAKSVAGANGLMQLMPGTARLIARRSKIKMSDIDMAKPEHNMFLGQKHIVDLLGHKRISNNIIKMLVSYNCGMGNMIKFEDRFKTDDPLLYIESFPAFETRNYIKRVMSNLWLYRARMDQPLNSIEDLADGQWPLYNSADEYVQRQIADRGSI